MTDPGPFSIRTPPLSEQDGPPWIHDLTWRPNAALATALLARIRTADGPALAALWIEIHEAWLGQEFTRDQDLELCEAWSGRLARLTAPEGEPPIAAASADAFSDLEFRIRTADGLALGKLGGAVASAAEAGQLTGDHVNTLHACWERRLAELVAPEAGDA